MVLTALNSCERATMTRGSGVRDKILCLDGADDGGDDGGDCDEVMEAQRDEDKVQDPKSKSGRGRRKELFERVLIVRSSTRICMRNEWQPNPEVPKWTELVYSPSGWFLNKMHEGVDG